MGCGASSAAGSAAPTPADAPPKPVPPTAPQAVPVGDEGAESELRAEIEGLRRDLAAARSPSSIANFLSTASTGELQTTVAFIDDGSSARLLTVLQLKDAAAVPNEGVSSATLADDLPAAIPSASTTAAPAVPAAPAASEDDDYFGFIALLETVSSRAIAPLRASYVIELHKEGKRICRRQDLPARAFWTAEDLSDLLERLRAKLGPEVGSQRFGLLCVALSYRWLSPGDCDPDGFHLAIVSQTAALYLSTSLKGNVFGPLELAEAEMDFAIFWDQASLFQVPRSEEEEPLFRLGLRGSNIWYGHGLTVTWMQSLLPSGFSGCAYDESGWCFAEACLSSVLKAADRRLNLSLRDPACKKYSSLARVCAAGGGAPLTPERVARLLREEKRFTSPSADTEVVIGLYTRFFVAVAPTLGTLSIHGPGGADWGDVQVERLRESVPRFTVCRKLVLVDAPTTYAGARRVIAALPAAIEELEVEPGYLLPVRMLSGAAGKTHISFNASDGFFVQMRPKAEREQRRKLLNCGGVAYRFGHTTGVFVAALLADNRVTTSVLLNGNHLYELGGLAVAEMLQANTTIKKLELCDCSMGGTGISAIAGALRVNTALCKLSLDGNGLDEASLAAIREAVVARAVEIEIEIGGRRAPITFKPGVGLGGTALFEKPKDPSGTSPPPNRGVAG